MAKRAHIIKDTSCKQPRPRLFEKVACSKSCYKWTQLDPLKAFEQLLLPSPSLFCSSSHILLNKTSYAKVNTNSSHNKSHKNNRYLDVSVCVTGSSELAKLLKAWVSTDMFQSHGGQEAYSWLFMNSFWHYSHQEGKHGLCFGQARHQWHSSRYFFSPQHWSWSKKFVFKIRSSLINDSCSFWL